MSRLDLSRDGSRVTLRVPDGCPTLAFKPAWLSSGTLTLTLVHGAESATPAAEQKYEWAGYDRPLRLIVRFARLVDGEYLPDEITMASK